MTFLTGFTHGRADRFLTLAHHADSEHDSGFVLPRSQREQIAREAILAAARGARIDEGDITSILAQTAHQRGLSVTDIMVRAASMAEQYTGRQAFNWRSATPDQIRRYLASLGLEAGWRRALREAGVLGATRTADDGDDGVGSSFRHDETYLRSPAGQAMQALARECGLHWAVNRADILRMGEDAIRLFARTGFQQQSFDGLLEVGFTGRQVMRLVQRAEESGQDANEVARITRETVRRLGGGNPQTEREVRDVLTGFHDNPTDATAWQRVDDVLGRFEREGTAEQQEQARRQREIEEQIRRAAAEAHARAEREAAERAAREAERLRAEERARQEVAESARLAALLGEDTPTKTLATVVHEAPAKKEPAVQEGPPAKLAETRPPVP